MSREQHAWTKDDVEKLAECVRSATSVPHALELASQLFGRDISYSSADSTLRRNKLPCITHLLGRSTIPVGHRVKGNSTLERADGTSDRWVKTERDSDDPKFEPVPVGHVVRRTSTMLDSQGNARIQWVQAEREREEQWDAFVTACRDHMATYPRLSPELIAPASVADSDLCTVYPIGDPHIGMLAWARETGEDFDLRIAEADLLRTIDMLVDRTPPSKTGILAEVGDFFHAENDKQLTPHGGNKLDVDSRMSKVVRVGFSVMRRLTDRMLDKHALVKVVCVPGNHDPHLARALSVFLEHLYDGNPRVQIVDNANPYMYHRHGKVLLGFAHNDGCKPDQLDRVMAADRPEDWGDTIYRHWLTGHVHSKHAWELPGCLVETFNTLAPGDAWAHWKGYRSRRFLSAITYHTEWGEDSRVTQDIRRTRALSGDT